MHIKDNIKLGDTKRQKCKVWTYEMGYHQPEQYWNKGKIGKFMEGKYFTEKAIGTKCKCGK